MFYITDTHSIVWFLLDDSQLSARAKTIFEAIEKGKCTVLVPVLVLAEVMFLCERKHIQHIFSQLVKKLQEGANYFIYDLDLAIVLIAKELTNIPDIHDRLIAATAQIARAPVITRDRVLKKSGYISVVW